MVGGGSEKRLSRKVGSIKDFRGFFFLGKHCTLLQRQTQGRKKQHFLLSENIIFPCLKQQEQEQQGPFQSKKANLLGLCPQRLPVALVYGRAEVDVGADLVSSQEQEEVVRGRNAVVGDPTAGLTQTKKKKYIY